MSDTKASNGEEDIDDDNDDDDDDDDDVDDDDDDDDVIVAKHINEIPKQKSFETYLPNVGIVMSNTDILKPEVSVSSVNKQLAPSIIDVSLNQVVQNDVHIRKHPLVHAQTESKIDITKVGSLSSYSEQTTLATTPDIVVVNESEKLEPPKSLQISSTKDSRKINSVDLEKAKKFSHSSGEVDMNDEKEKQQTSTRITDLERIDVKRSNSERDLILGISGSQSENTLKSIRTTVLSPSAVLSPFSKLAKGVQSLGANLDPRKLKVSVEKVAKPILTEQHAVECVKFQEKWKKAKCKSRLIAI